jgi:hypothetical protein
MFLAKLQFAAALLLVAGGFPNDQSANRQEEPPQPIAPGARQPQPAVPATADLDSDGDGLPDFQEIHKYRTDPHKKHTAGQSTSDGDWDMRRQFTYSIRSVIRVMPPYNLQAMNDDYQDVRVLAETKEHVELEVISYPLNTNADAIQGNPNWKKDYAGMKEDLAPGTTTNWDDRMRDQLLRELRQSGIDPERLTDKEVVERVSRWLLTSSKHTNMFCTFFVHYPGGKPAIFPGLESAFQHGQGDRNWTPQQQFDRELLGKGMYEHKTYGTCTSAAVYWATVLRALGIPTRMILTIPLVDPCDDAQLDMVHKNIKHHQVRSTISNGLLAAGSGFTAHTYLEVYVGRRWRRLNYATLGQNTLDRNYLGLMVHVHTFRDLSEANLAATWGRRYALGQRDQNFRYSNPYRTLAISDLFGRYAKVPNPPANEQEHKQITISKAYWLDSEETPAPIKESWRTTGDDGSGRLLVHGEEWFQGMDHLQYKFFMKRADKRFVFWAKDQPDVQGYVSMNFYTHASRNLREMEVVIPKEEYAKMVKGVAYTLHPVNGTPLYQWKVQKGVTITRK